MMSKIEHETNLNGDNPFLPLVSSYGLFQANGELWASIDVIPDTDKNIHILMQNGCVRVMRYVGFYTDCIYPAPDKPIFSQCLWGDRCLDDVPVGWRYCDDSEISYPKSTPNFCG